MAQRLCGHCKRGSKDEAKTSQMSNLYYLFIIFILFTNYFPV